MKKTIKFITFLCASLIAANIFAADLMDVYEQARLNDPTFKSKKFEWLAVKQDIAINRASLLPQLSAQGSLSRTRTELDSSALGVIDTSYKNDTAYGLTLSQSVFNFGNWAKVWGAEARSKSAHATFLAAEQDLLLRTAQSYFSVLLSKSILKSAKANKSATKRIFVQAKHKHDVGIIPITDLEESRTKYDLAVADEIKFKNELDNNIEKLSEITKARFANLAQPKNGLPLHSPNPSDINKWSKFAEQQNFSLLATRYNTIAAREDIKVQNAGHLPTIDLQASHNYGFNDRTKLRQKTTTATAGITIPLFQGGGVYASAKKYDYLYQRASAEQEKTHRKVVSETRQSYHGVLSSISKVKADKQAIKSARSSLRANRASYSVGTQTMSDVLTAQKVLFDAQRTFAEDEYNYIIQFLKLKELAGILDVKDIQQINSWLKDPEPKAKKQHAKKAAATKSKSKKNVKIIVTKKVKKGIAKDIALIGTKEIKKADFSLIPSARAANKTPLKRK